MLRRRIPNKIPILTVGRRFHIVAKGFSSKSVSGSPLVKPRILVLGSGWGGYIFSKSVDRKKYDVRIISPSNHFLFTPLLPSSAVGTLEFRAIQEPVRTIKGISEFYHAKATTVDFQNREITCHSVFEHEKNDFKVKYDYLIVACGSKTNTFNTPGISEREGKEVFFLKHLFHARQIRNRIVECFERAAIHDTEPHERDRLLNFIVVGGGPTSVEFVGELHDLVTRDMKKYYPELQSHVRVHLIEAGPRLLPSFHPDLGKLVESRFRKRGIDVRTGTAVKSFHSAQQEKYIILDKGQGGEMETEKLPVGLLVWSAGLEQVKFVQNAFPQCQKGQGGRLVVDEHLMVLANLNAGNSIPGVPQLDSRVFAIGDCAVNPEKPLAPLAIVAKQQAHYLANGFNQVPSDMIRTLSEDSGALVSILKPKPFSFLPFFSMVTFGSMQGAIDFSALAPNQIKKSPNLYLHGLISFLTWRSAYWGMQTSISNKLLIPMYWFKSFVFGRDISRF